MKQLKYPIQKQTHRDIGKVIGHITEPLRSEDLINNYIAQKFQEIENFNHEEDKDIIFHQSYLSAMYMYQTEIMKRMDIVLNSELAQREDKIKEMQNKDLFGDEGGNMAKIN